MSKFGTFLIEKGLVKDEDVLAALNRQRSLQRPLGEIAIDEKVMTPRQVFSVLNHQVHAQKKFGEIAVAMGQGYVSESQVEKLLEIQQAGRPNVGEILLEMGLIDSHTLNSALNEFLSHRKGLAE